MLKVKSFEKNKTDYSMSTYLFTFFPFDLLIFIFYQKTKVEKCCSDIYNQMLGFKKQLIRFETNERK